MSRDLLGAVLPFLILIGLYAGFMRGARKRAERSLAQQVRLIDQQARLIEQQEALVAAVNRVAEALEKRS